MKTLKLGEIIEQLRRIPAEQIIYYDFAAMNPTKLLSFRGDYAQLALGWGHYDTADEMTVGALRVHLSGSLGEHFEGYKGGGRVATADSIVWVANVGETSDTAISKITNESCGAIIHTRWTDFQL